MQQMLLNSFTIELEPFVLYQPKVIVTQTGKSVKPFVSSSFSSTTISVTWILLDECDFACLTDKQQVGFHTVSTYILKIRCESFTRWLVRPPRPLALHCSCPLQGWQRLPKLPEAPGMSREGKGGTGPGVRGKGYVAQGVLGPPPHAWGPRWGANSGVGSGGWRYAVQGVSGF